jgi:hypothetical protein
MEVPQMSTLRKLATLGTAAVVALALLAAPASATAPGKQQFSRTAVLDCGSGPFQAGANDALWSPLVDLRSGQQYKPVAWDVAGEGFAVSVSKNQTKDSVVCSYDDGEASGTVTVRKIQR